MNEANPKSAAEAANGETDWIADLLTRAEAGDQSILPQVEEMLKNKHLTELLGNLAHRVELMIIEGVTGGNIAMREALTKKLGNMRAELCGPDATPLERQLVERVVLCWLGVHDAELRAVLMAASSEDTDKWQRRIDHAHKRYLSAVKTLATVRKLAIPVIIGQVNFGQEQSNKAEILTASA